MYLYLKNSNVKFIIHVEFSPQIANETRIPCFNIMDEIHEQVKLSSQSRRLYLDIFQFSN